MEFLTRIACITGKMYFRLVLQTKRFLPTVKALKLFVNYSRFVDLPSPILFVSLCPSRTAIMHSLSETSKKNASALCVRDCRILKKKQPPSSALKPFNTFIEMGIFGHIVTL